MSSKIMPVTAGLLRNFRPLQLKRAMIDHTVKETIAPLKAGDFKAFAEGLFVVKARSAPDQAG
jgi:hypothetical protein